MSDEDKRFWFGGFCGLALSSLCFWVALAVTSGDWHRIVMDQGKVDAYRAKVAAEAALGGEK